MEIPQETSREDVVADLKAKIADLNEAIMEASYHDISVILEVNSTWNMGFNKNTSPPIRGQVFQRL